MGHRICRIGLVADTHVPDALPCLPDSLRKALSGVDRIVHAGDLTSLDVLESLAEIAPTIAVCGNCDGPTAAMLLPQDARFDVHGRTLGVRHGHQPHDLQALYIGREYDAPPFDRFYETMLEQLDGANIIVFGHFHAPLAKEWRGTLFVNPGSVAPHRSRSTCAILEIDSDGSARVRHVDLTQPEPRFT